MNLTTNQLEVIVNPVTGDRMTVIQSSLENGGKYAKIRFDLPPGAKGSPLHYHTNMSETFTVIEGCLEMEVGSEGNWRTLKTGESVHILAGVQHSFRNSSSVWVTFTSENRPAGGFEQFIQGMYGLAIDGKVDREGMPTNLLQLALLLKKADTILVGPPMFVQKLLINSLVQIGHWWGVERSLNKYWSQSDRHS